MTILEPLSTTPTSNKTATTALTPFPGLDELHWDEDLGYIVDTSCHSDQWNGLLMEYSCSGPSCSKTPNKANGTVEMMEEESGGSACTYVQDSASSNCKEFNNSSEEFSEEDDCKNLRKNENFLIPMDSSGTKQAVMTRLGGSSVLLCTPV